MEFWSILLLALFASSQIVHGQTVAEGNAIAERLLQKYPALRVWASDDGNYPRPHGVSVDGSATNHPVVSFIVPEVEWRALPLKQQISLTMFVNSQIQAIRDEPERYALTPASAPYHETEIEHIRNIGAGFWCISTAVHDPDDDVNFYAGSALVAGDIACQSGVVTGAMKASDLRKQLSSSPGEPNHRQ